MVPPPTPIRLLVVMDPIASSDPKKDSTLAMVLEAQRRGWDIAYAETRDIWIHCGEARGRLQDVRVTDAGETGYQYELGETFEAALGAFDAVLMRKDPPFDMEYIYATYILERAEEAGAVVVNRAASLRDVNEKVFISWFPEVSALALISRSLPELRAFIEHHGRAVLKPLDRMGGRSVFLIEPRDPNRNVLLETMTEVGSRYVMVQKYISDIAESGDARILLIDGEPVPTALVRVPPAGDHRGSISVGAATRCRPLTPEECKICEVVGPVLRERGILFAGIDVIGGLMTEINVTSPTGIRELERDASLPVTQLLLDAIELRVSASPARRLGERS